MPIAFSPPGLPAPSRTSPLSALSLAPVTVKFPHRSRRGILLGLSLSQLILVSSALALALVTVVSTGLLGAIALTPLWAAVAALVAIRRHGRSLIDWAPIVARYAHHRRTGQTLYLARPVTRPRQDGLLHLPGTAASSKSSPPATPPTAPPPSTTRTNRPSPPSPASPAGPSPCSTPQPRTTT